jgi:Snare region anchored in the vesicle membrane C-terminus
MSGHKYLTGALCSDDEDDGNSPFGEVQSIKKKTKEIQNKALNSTKTSMGVIEETLKIGSATATELHRQGDQLKRAKDTLEEVDGNLERSDLHLKRIQSPFLQFFKSFGGRKKVNLMPSQTTKAEIQPKLTSSADKSFSHQPSTSPTQQIPGSFDDQLCQDLDDINRGLSGLKNLAIDMNQEIIKQDVLIGGIKNHLDNVDNKLGCQNEKMKKILGKK